MFGVMTSASATRCILVSCGSFTRETRLFAEGKPIALVEGPELWNLVQSVKTTSLGSSAKNQPCRYDSIIRLLYCCRKRPPRPIQHQTFSFTNPQQLQPDCRYLNGVGVG
ncbi:MAG: restriction endonuclease [Phycisphaerales bacterium]|nr:restriction endonuclease [Phycisphaerales bacterium]